MRDLYKRVGLTAETDDSSTIQGAIEGQSNQEVAHAARAILLNPRRKASYDRHRRVLVKLGQLRANLGLTNSPQWTGLGLDDFNAEPGPPPSRLERIGRRVVAQGQRELPAWIVLCFGGVILVGMVLGLLAAADIASGTKQSRVYSPSPSNNSYSPGPAYSPGVPESFTQPEVLLPENGYTIRFDMRTGVAPLEVVTRPGEGHYYVKVVDWNTKEGIAAFFVRSGCRAEIKVPLGSMEIRYAAGETWYGPEYLFGPTTRYVRADERFDFTQTGSHISGYTVELFLQANGNLETDPISAEQF